ncbi:heat shock protein HSP10 [Cryptosporidium andersoni]|uniref:Heat shock protein HSP10 n=1 Tax=Cryptosporidium andersoni TaxID=117008 RepID=A0A1J4MNL4_9CRYT|nr:heat shock protein HSP10 [Cryptosporidium andersoni]
MAVANIIKRFKPLLDRVLVQRFRPETITKSGLFLPDSATKGSIASLQGLVLSVGPGKRNKKTGEYIKCSVKPGDVVVIPEYGGIPFKIENKNDQNRNDDLFIYREDDLVGIMEGGKLE